jgi:hypothetical protein
MFVFLFDFGRSMFDVGRSSFKQLSAYGKKEKPKALNLFIDFQ